MICRTKGQPANRFYDVGKAMIGRRMKSVRKVSAPLYPADQEIGKTPARPHHLRVGGLRERWHIYQYISLLINYYLFIARTRLRPLPVSSLHIPGL